MNEKGSDINKGSSKSAFGYMCQLYSEGKLAHISDADTVGLYDALITFDIKQERPTEIDELEYLISEGYTFPEIIAGVATGLVKDLVYESGKFQYATLDLGQSTSVKDLLKEGKTPPQGVKSGNLPLITKDLSYIDELKLAYAKRKIFAFFQEYPNLNTKLYKTVQECVRISDFFVRELGNLSTQYPEAYTSADYSLYADAHTPDEILEKIQDKKRRFIRYVQDDSGKIVTYFESRKSPMFPDTQVIQWSFTDESIRRTGEVRKIWDEFIGWCIEQGYTSVWSYAALKNEVSHQVHDALMGVPDRTLYSPNTLLFVQSVAKIGSFRGG